MEEGVGGVNNNNNKVKMHRRPAEEVGQKEELMPVVEEVVMANQQVLLQRLVDSKCRMVVKLNLHQSPSEHPVEVVGDAVEEVGVATGDAEVAAAWAEVVHRRQKETQMPLPLKREMRSRQPPWTLKTSRKQTYR